MERRKRAESALITVVADCYLAGVSTRRMDKLVKTLGIDRLSKSQVFRMATDLDEHVEQFRHRPLGDAGPFTFISADALTMKVREGGRVVNSVVMLATGVNADGHREVLGMRVATAETGPAWNEFFADVKCPPTRSTFQLGLLAPNMHIEMRAYAVKNTKYVEE